MSGKSKIFIGVGIAIVVLVGLFFIGNWYAKSKIEEALTANFSDVSYEDLSVNIFSGSASISDLHLASGKTQITATDFQLKDLSYYSYLVNDKVNIDKLNFQELEIVRFKEDSTSSKDSTSGKNSFSKEVLIKDLNVSNGIFKIAEKNSVAIFYISFPEVNIKELTRKSESEGRKIPFSYEEATVVSDSIYYNMNREHYITVNKAEYKNKGLILENLNIVPKFSKEEFAEKVSLEKDRVELWVKRTEFQSFDWDFENDTLKLTSPLGIIKDADLFVYRNKILPDDPSPRNLYSKMLREMGTKIKLDSVRLENSNITYEEKTAQTRPAGKLEIKDVTASIQNITNLDLGREDFPKTRVAANAQLFGTTPLSLNWSFTVPGKDDEFDVEGRFGELNAETANSFLVPALNVKAQGTIKYIYFNFFGNSYNLTGDVKMSYDDFKLKVLEKGENEKQWLKTTIANLLIKNDVEGEEVEQVNIEVEREVTNSFWNYLWSAVRTGIKETATRF